MKPLTSVNVQEISAAGPVTEDDNVKVSAILVEHPPVKPAFGYRFNFQGRLMATSSGDTAPLEAVAKMAKGADVLVHETMYVPAVEKYIKGQIAQGRPVKFEAFMAHERRATRRARMWAASLMRQASKHCVWLHRDRRRRRRPGAAAILQGQRSART